MYSNEKIGRLNQSTSIQASRLNESTSIQATQSNKTEPVFVELKVPFIGEPTIEFAKQANLTALKSFRSTVSVESQVRIIEKLYNFHTSEIEFDESLEKYHIVVGFVKTIFDLILRYKNLYLKTVILNYEALLIY